MSTLSTSSTSLPPLPTDESSFPKWWPRTDSDGTYIAFADHIAHVMVPNITEKGTHDGGDATLTCEEVVQWVLTNAKERTSQGEQQTSISNSIKAIPGSAIIAEENPDHNDDNDRRLRIEREWAEGEFVSTPLKVLDPGYRHDPSLYPQTTTNDALQPNLIAAELLALGSVWHLPYSSTTAKPNIDRFDPSNGVKPMRLNAGDWNKTANAGDYFRVHFDPRRFVDANLYDWGNADGVVASGGGGGVENRPGVIVARDDEAGYIIINKPPNIPVHARVDNLLENVASSVGRSLWMERRESILADVMAVDDDDRLLSSNATYYKKKRKNRKQKKEQLVYVATPQRLDQNTSGLLVVASKKSFASYFAKLLRTKTSGQLQQALSNVSSSRTSSCGVHKSYRCLVCIAPKNEAGEAETTSMASEIDRLNKYTHTIMKHFLEPSIRAPKRFVQAVPENVDNTEYWAECLLKITNISEICTVVGNAPSQDLARALWGDHGKPDDCIAVAECEIELLTGRTHQIRGQLAAEGFPLVGDVQYGGAVPSTSSLYKERCKGRVESFLDSEHLALQCCSLEFLDPNHVVKSDGSDAVKRSQRWKSFRLDSAFWTPFLAGYHDKNAKIDSSEATSSLTDEAPLLKQANQVSEQQYSEKSTAGELPPKVVISQGLNKYVVVRAVLQEDCDNILWFVRSASPEECGGPYHANVAQPLLLQLESLGYTTTVMGGGRIDFVENEKVSHAHVFGFSYGFGKFDHEKVADIIEQHTNSIATFDNSDGLY
ncbi:hypothetical protein ACHAXR_006159 [Thalassiosira sp. AJA248-18]